MEQKALTTFGQELMTEVRDRVLSDLNQTISGQMLSDSAQQLHTKFEKLTDEDKSFFIDAIVQYVDLTIFKFLFMFEETDNWAVIDKEVAESNKLDDIAKLSDGLVGELFTEDGWIARFSKFGEKPNIG